MQMVESMRLAVFSVLQNGNVQTDGAEGGRQKKKCNLRDQRRTARYILSAAGESVTEIPI